MTGCQSRTTHAQCALLDEVEAAGVLYVSRYKRYARTIRALLDKGLVFIAEPDHSRLGMDGYSLTDQGRKRFGGRLTKRCDDA